MIYWPEDLPQTFTKDSYAEAMAAGTIRQNMEVGPAKVRKRSSSQIRPVGGDMIMTLAELEIFKAFYIDDLCDGALRFTFHELLDEDTAIEVRFTESPSWVVFGNDLKVSMRWEIMP